MSVFGASLSRLGTKASELGTPIDLKDNTKPAVDEANVDGGRNSEEDTPPLPAVTRKDTKGSTLREQLARRKYRKYQRDRYYGASDDEEPTPETPGPSLERHGTNASSTTADSLRADDNAAPKEGKLRRGKGKAKELFRSHTRIQRKHEGQMEIEILYENQRGTFFFGMPLYSSESLLNFDPPAWTTADGSPSPVDISNAQLPDPNWEWSWRTWYVDMSQDVDEQGWQYSFMFQKRFPWHGSHPWLHSFVRRRRWVRKRVRAHRHLADGRVEGGQTMKDAHRLNADYFTIHPARERSPDSSYARSGLADSALEQTDGKKDEEKESDEIETMQALIKRMKEASVDREKINAVLQFIEQGGQQVHYLADEMEHIMSLFLFQYTRKQLLSRMSRKMDAASAHRDEHEEREEAEDESEKQQIDNLLRAVMAADEQIQKLEYWSDIKDVVREGESFGATAEAGGWEHEWQGLDNSGPGQLLDPLEKANSPPNKQDGSAQQERPENTNKGKGRALDSKPENTG